MSLRPKQDVHIESLRARWKFGPEVERERLWRPRFERHKNKVDNAIKKGRLMFNFVTPSTNLTCWETPSLRTIQSKAGMEGGWQWENREFGGPQSGGMQSRRNFIKEVAQSALEWGQPGEDFVCDLLSPPHLEVFRDDWGKHTNLFLIDATG